MKGSELVAKFMGQSLASVEAQILANRSWWVVWQPVEVELQIPGHSGSLYVASDYFAVGEPDDFVHWPLSAPGAQAVANACSAMQPTQKMVDLIWTAAGSKLAPITGGELGIQIGSSDQVSVRAAALHSAAVRKHLLSSGPLELVAGTKKDVVLSNRLESFPGRVCIYGWHRTNGVPIQPLSTIHEESYADYSHGLRLVFETMLFDGQSISVRDFLASKFAQALSYEGVLRVLRQPSKPSTMPPPPPPPAPVVRTLRLGCTGADVSEWQKIVGIGPTGYFGPITEAATKHWQKAHGLVDDGVVGPASRKAAASSSSITIVSGSADPALDTGRHGDFEGVAFVQARNYTRADPGRKVLWVVLHAMQIAEKGETAEACASYFHSTDRLASAHLCVDANSTVQSVLLRDVAFGAPGANRGGIHIEHAGFAEQTAAEWDDNYSQAMLLRSAGLCADICKMKGLPVEFVDAEGLLAGVPGITTHYQCTLAERLAKKRGLTSSPFYKASSNGHTDPGAQFPMGPYLQMVREAA